MRRKKYIVSWIIYAFLRVDGDKTWKISFKTKFLQLYVMIFRFIVSGNFPVFAKIFVRGGISMQSLNALPCLPNLYRDGQV